MTTDTRRWVSWCSAAGSAEKLFPSESDQRWYDLNASGDHNRRLQCLEEGQDVLAVRRAIKLEFLLERYCERAESADHLCGFLVCVPMSGMDRPAALSVCDVLNGVVEPDEKQCQLRRDTLTIDNASSSGCPRVLSQHSKPAD
jgi:hypothetical protein